MRAEAMSMAVTGIGMVSPLGLDAETSCAAARAGLSRAAPLDSFKLYSKSAWADVGVTGHSVREFAGGFEGFGKLVRLGSGALGDLLRRAEQSTSQDGSRTAFCVALPSGYLQSTQERDPKASQPEEPFQSFLQTLTDSLLPRLCELATLPVPAANQGMVFQDQAGFARGLMHAWHLLSAGKVDRCILGGIDACTDSRYLTAAHHFNVLKTEEQPAGFQPGEGAAFVMLESAAAALARGAPIAGCIEAAAIGTDPIQRCSGKPALGVGLAQTIAACMQARPPEPDVGWMIADLNGDAFRANDWGYAQSRLIAEFPQLGGMPGDYPRGVIR
jgi:3-oxoacyl-[acyl-carrier-protein] synthase-1